MRPAELNDSLPVAGAATSPRKRVNVLGVGVDPVNPARAVEIIERWIATRDRQYVCVSGIHGVMESQRDESLRVIHNQAGLVVPDGMPLVWLSWLQGFRQADRVYGPDLMLECCGRSIRTGHRHYFYGGGSGVPEQLVSRLQERFPGLPVAGTFSPPFRPLAPEEEGAVVHRINAARPDIVWVGLSTPKQERWMAEHRGRLEAPVLIGVGAAFDFHAGLKRQAPRWIQRSGLEWLFRLTTEPRRLWRRYLRNNPVFVGRLLLQSLGVRRYDIDVGPELPRAGSSERLATIRSSPGTSCSRALDCGTTRSTREPAAPLGDPGQSGARGIGHSIPRESETSTHDTARRADPC